MSYEWITNEMFDETIRELSREAGVDHILGIPGVWEEVSEYFNNKALDRLTQQRSEIQRAT